MDDLRNFTGENLATEVGFQCITEADHPTALRLARLYAQRAETRDAMLAAMRNFALVADARAADMAKRGHAGFAQEIAAAAARLRACAATAAGAATP